MNYQDFRGTWTALITPFTQNDQIDWEAIERLVEIQIEGGVTGILVVGTTGESPTLTEDEFIQLIKKTKEFINSRCKLMVGTGTNCTRTTCEKTKKATELGPDAIMIVNPYYNKPTQEGLYQHFKAASESTDLPVLVYNIKGRTGVNIETETLLRIAKDCPNVFGVKEASGDMGQIAEVCKVRSEGFIVLSGDDGLTFEIISEHGGDGVISVASNIAPRQVTEMVNAALEGETETASELNEELQELFNNLFVETNPIPVKYAASLMDLCEANYRLPICPPSEKAAKVVEETLKSANLL